MAITNGYATLAEVKQAMDIANTYTALTISFDTTADTISDSAYGLKRFQDEDIIEISGSTSNNGTFNIASGGNVAGSFTVTENLTTEIAGDTVTITVIQDQKDDTTIERAINAASRWIDDQTGTRFYTTASDETRYYTVNNRGRFFCPDDIISITTLKTDDDGDRTYENTWTVSTDFDLIPYNATLHGDPYTGIEVTPNGGYSFTQTRKGVEIAGKFGFSSSTPDGINEACIMLAQRYLKRKDAPLGIAGNITVGFIQLQHALDPDVEALLSRWLTRRAYG